MAHQIQGVDAGAVRNMLAQAAERDLDGPYSALVGALETIEETQPGTALVVLDGLQAELLQQGYDPGVNL